MRDSGEAGRSAWHRAGVADGSIAGVPTLNPRPSKPRVYGGVPRSESPPAADAPTVLSTAVRPAAQPAATGRETASAPSPWSPEARREPSVRAESAVRAESESAAMPTAPASPQPADASRSADPIRGVGSESPFEPDRWRPVTDRAAVDEPPASSSAPPNPPAQTPARSSAIDWDAATAAALSDESTPAMADDARTATPPDALLEDLIREIVGDAAVETATSLHPPVRSVRDEQRAFGSSGAPGSADLPHAELPTEPSRASTSDTFSDDGNVAGAAPVPFENAVGPTGSETGEPADPGGVIGQTARAADAAGDSSGPTAPGTDTTPAPFSSQAPAAAPLTDASPTDVPLTDPPPADSPPADAPPADAPPAGVSPTSALPPVAPSADEPPEGPTLRPWRIAAPDEAPTATDLDPVPPPPDLEPQNVAAPSPELLQTKPDVSRETSADYGGTPLAYELADETRRTHRPRRGGPAPPAIDPDSHDLEPEGRRRQDDDRREPRRCAGSVGCPRARDRPRPPGQRIDRARRRAPLRAAERLRRDRRRPAAAPRSCSRSTEHERLDCVPATIHLAGAEIELVSLVAREQRLRRALDTHLATDGTPVRLRLHRLPAVARPADDQRVRRRARGAHPDPVRVLRARGALASCSATSS